MRAAATGSSFRAGDMKDWRVFRHITVNAEAQIMGFPDTLQIPEHGSRPQLWPRPQRLPARCDGAIHGILLSPRRSIARAVVRWWLNCALGLALLGAALKAAEEVPRGSASQSTKDDSQSTVDEESRPAADAAVAATLSAGTARPPRAPKGLYLSFWFAASDRRVGALTELGCGHRSEAAVQCCFAETLNIATAIAVGTSRARLGMNRFELAAVRTCVARAVRGLRAAPARARGPLSSVDGRNYRAMAAMAIVAAVSILESRCSLLSRLFTGSGITNSD